MNTTFAKTVNEIGSFISSHSELKVDATHLTVSKRDLQVASEKYKAFLKPSHLALGDYTNHLTASLNEADLKKPLIALDHQNVVYVYLPA